MRVRRPAATWDAPRVTDTLLRILETYCDEAPRPSADAEEPSMPGSTPPTTSHRSPARQRRLMAEGLRCVVAAYDDRGHVVGGGSHGPRGGTTELTGIAERA